MIARIAVIAAGTQTYIVPAVAITSGVSDISVRPHPGMWSGCAGRARYLRSPSVSKPTRGDERDGPVCRTHTTRERS